MCDPSSASLLPFVPPPCSSPTTTCGGPGMQLTGRAAPPPPRPLSPPQRPAQQRGQEAQRRLELLGERHVRSCAALRQSCLYNCSACVNSFSVVACVGRWSGVLGGCVQAVLGPLGLPRGVGPPNPQPTERPGARDTPTQAARALCRRPFCRVRLPLPPPAIPPRLPEERRPAGACAQPRAAHGAMPCPLRFIVAGVSGLVAVGVLIYSTSRPEKVRAAMEAAHMARRAAACLVARPCPHCAR